MGLFQIVAILVTLAALFSFINYRYLRLPSVIGVLAISLAASIVLVIVGAMGTNLRHQAALALSGIDFNRALLHGALGFMLFAGSLTVDLSSLWDQKGTVLILATVGVLVSTAVVGGLAWVLFYVLKMDVPLSYCFLFGALISPTDPVAVLSIVRRAGASATLQTKIAGESLFNDGVGVVTFMLLLEFAAPRHEAMTVLHTVGLILGETVGAVLLGLALGWIAFQLLKRVDQYQTEAMLTLALVMGGYTLAESIHTSAPIVMVVAGLFIGNHGRAFAMSDMTRHHLDVFWELIDEILNLVLFALIGLEMLVMPLEPRYAIAGIAAIAISLFARYVTVHGAVTILRPFRTFSPGVVPILTWAGLRGGISVAMALSLPGDDHAGPREAIIALTYAVVVFSILVQGLSIGVLVRHYAVEQKPPEPAQAGGAESAPEQPPETEPPLDPATEPDTAPGQTAPEETEPAPDENSAPQE